MSTCDTAPVASRGLVCASSCCASSSPRWAALRRAWASVRSCSRCAICWRTTASCASSSERRDWYRRCSSSMVRRSSSSLAAGGTKGLPSANARSRAARACSAMPVAALSRMPAVARVSSTRSSIWPASTTWPSWTAISETMPPSSDCTTWSWRDGITRASPRVTSSTGASAAQSSSRSTATTAARTIFWARCVPWREISASASASNGCSPASRACWSSIGLPSQRFVTGSSSTRTRSSRACRRWPLACSLLMGRPFVPRTAVRALGSGPARSCRPRDAAALQRFHDAVARAVGDNLPLSTTITRLTNCSSDVRCVTSSTVLPWANSARRWVTCASVVKSIALVGSSSSRIGALCSTARAMPTAWRCPPDSARRVRPPACRSPWGGGGRSPPEPADLGGGHDAPCRRHAACRSVMFSRSVPWNSSTSCDTQPMLRRTSAGSSWRRSMPSSSTRAVGVHRLEQAHDQTLDGRSCPSRRGRSGHLLAGGDAQADAVEREVVPVRVGEAHAAELDLALEVAPLHEGRAALGRTGAPPAWPSACRATRARCARPGTASAGPTIWPAGASARPASMLAAMSAPIVICARRSGRRRSGSRSPTPSCVSQEVPYIAVDDSARMRTRCGEEGVGTLPARLDHAFGALGLDGLQAGQALDQRGVALRRRAPGGFRQLVQPVLQHPAHARR
jgi:hypothetical protein